MKSETSTWSSSPTQNETENRLQDVKSSTVTGGKPAPERIGAYITGEGDRYTPHQDLPDSAFATDTVSIGAVHEESMPELPAMLTQLQSRISSGCYRVSGDDVADAMMRKGLFNTKIN